MTRPIESATARWQDIDLDKKGWVIPAERMKMKKPHTIPLTPQTLALPDVIHAMSGNQEYLFPSHRDPRGHANSQSANMDLKRMDFAGELVLRALASTTLNEQGFDPDVIDAAYLEEFNLKVKVTLEKVKSIYRYFYSRLGRYFTRLADFSKIK